MLLAESKRYEQLSYILQKLCQTNDKVKQSFVLPCLCDCSVFVNLKEKNICEYISLISIFLSYLSFF